MKKLIKRLPPYSVTIAVMALILYLTLVPRPLPDTDLPVFEGADKMVHAIMFGALTFAIALDVTRRRESRLTTRVALVCAVIATVTGGVIELAQGWMAMGRGCEWADFGADAAGAVIVALLSPYLMKKLY